MASDQWHVTVQNRLPGHPLTMLDGRLLEEVLQLVERQAGAAIPAGDRDFTGYLNLSNIHIDGEQITGVVDWDEFGLGSRALDLIVLALDCQERGAPAAAGRLLASAAAAVGNSGVRCLVSYRALAALAEETREG